jgi:hypothetical protein
MSSLREIISTEFNMIINGQDLECPHNSHFWLISAIRGFISGAHTRANGLM